MRKNNKKVAKDIQTLGSSEDKPIPDDQALNLPRFINNQFYGGYCSVSKSYGVAKAFATNANGTVVDGGPRNAGWVYVCLVEGGFVIPAKGTVVTVGSDTGAIPYNEQEISMPGILEWDDVVACRKVHRTGAFEGRIYIKQSLIMHDIYAAREIFFLLSGLSQGKQPS
ncbi:hypothetical protein ABLE91_03995 [Aquabacter sp. CN5-332]|uniref:hypothetical protein n=1 Tax=Aquabacter sp. CN5-332 TaxID=3156608 RepID=UPI0032B323D7